MSGVPVQARLLDQYLADSSSVIAREPVTDDPYPEGCDAASDCVAGDREGVDTLLTYCRPLEESAAHHAWSICRGLIEPCLVISLFTAARAVLESAATGLWVLDSQVSPQERLRRSLVLRFENVQQQQKLARCNGNERAVAAAGVSLEKICNRARGWGLEVVSAKQPRLAGPDASKTRLAGDTLGEEEAYRILSGSAHGQLTYLQRLGMQEIDVDPMSYEVALHPEVLTWITLRPLDWCARLTYRLREYRGLPMADLEAILETTYTSMGGNAEERFWRM